jgi:hypothetical protein
LRRNAAAGVLDIGAIWGRRFTVPKVLGFMVQRDTQNPAGETLASKIWIVPKS